MMTQSASILVLDTAAFVSGISENTSFASDSDAIPSSTHDSFHTKLLSKELQLYTIQEVIEEIRDMKARERLNSLKEFLTIRSPSEFGMSKVIEFSKKTGDFASLSKTDLKVLGLSVTLVLEQHGDSILNEIPMPLKIQQYSSNKLSQKSIQNSTAESTTTAKHEVMESKSKNERNLLGNESKSECDEWITVKPRKVSSRRGKVKASLSAKGINTVTGESVTGEKDGEKVEKNKEMGGDSGSEKEMGSEKCRGLEEEDDGGGDWIGVETVDERFAEDMGIGNGNEMGIGNGNEMEMKKCSVGCVTSDFAMQNVLLQMGILLVDVSGRQRVRQIRRFVLVCQSCNALSVHFDREFCATCGHHSLQKIPCKSNPDGSLHLYLNSQWKPRIRGTKYSIPLPKGGRNNTDLILSEDMLNLRKQKQNAGKSRLSDEDTLLDPTRVYNAGARYDRTVPVQYGYGRKNPNAVKSTTTNKKK